MKRALLGLGLFITLGGCPGQPVTNNTIEPTPTPTATPWLTVEPICSGAITRAEWLVCDNATLNAVHRRLAQEWASARQYATPEKEQVLEDQLYALLSERDQCQDVTCVATAYRRYISGPVPTPSPTSTWKPRPKPKPTKKVWRRPRPHGTPWIGRDEDEGPACSATAGVNEAQRLSRQCDRVTEGRDWSCRPTQSCGTLRRNIVKGCNETYRKPDFCPRL